MSSPAKALSAPFASRELNGELLLEELQDLRDARIGSQPLIDCALAVRGFKTARVSDAALKLKQLAGNRFQGQPALAGLLMRWAMKLKSEQDVTALVSHLERLALTAALLSAMRRQGASP